MILVIWNYTAYDFIFYLRLKRTLSDYMNEILCNYLNFLNYMESEVHYFRMAINFKNQTILFQVCTVLIADLHN